MEHNFTDEQIDVFKKSALTNEHIQCLKWKPLANGDMEISYLKPNGNPELCTDRAPFTRKRISDKNRLNPTGKGKKQIAKYISPKGEGNRIYHSHIALTRGNYPDRLDDRYVPLRITEGELKTEAASAHDPDCITIGLSGVTSWKDKRDNKEKSNAIPELTEIKLKGREVRLAFDSDLNKPQVKEALRTLATFLQEVMEAHVLIEILPNGLDNKRLGIDDLVYRHGANAFLDIKSIARSPFKIKEKDGQIEYQWYFKPEPKDDHERNVYLKNLLGEHWKQSELSKESWYYWTGTHWQVTHGNSDIYATIEKFAEIQGWKNRQQTTVSGLTAAFRRSIGKIIENQEDAIIPFKNGCLRLRDKVFIPHSPCNGNTWVLTVDYVATQECPNIKAFILDRLEDENCMQMFRAMAYCVITGTRIKAFLEITGVPNTGKSILGNLILAVTGKDNFASMTLQRLEDRSSRFETAKLLGKRLLLASECHDYVGRLEVLKSITGGDPIPGEIKNGKLFDFTFHGGVILIGNGPIKAIDPSGAVINRRRSLFVDKVVETKDEKVLLEPDGRGGWKGELLSELSGFVNWVMDMSEGEAREALSRDLKSLARAKAESRSLIETNSLAEWANIYLAWSGDPKHPSLRVGHKECKAEEGYQYPKHLNWMHQQGLENHLISLKRFKKELVTLLRDTLGLPMPPGDLNNGAYKDRKLGSVIPCLRERDPLLEEGPGIIDYAFRLSLGIPISGPAMDAGRIVDGKNQAGDECDGRNGSKKISRVDEKNKSPDSDGGSRTDESVGSIPIRPQEGLCIHKPVTADSKSIPILVDGKPGWSVLRSTKLEGARTGKVLVQDPQGESRLIERSRINRLIPHPKSAN